MRWPRHRRAIVCRQLVELVTDYLEGDLDPADRAAVEDHLATCGDCHGYVQQVRIMLDLTADLGRSERIAPWLLEELSTQYRSRRVGRP